MRKAAYALFLVCGITVGIFQLMLINAGAARGLGFGIYFPVLVIIFGPCSFIGAYIAGKVKGDAVLKGVALFTVSLYVFQGLTFLGVLGVSMDYIARAYAVTTIIASVSGVILGGKKKAI